MKTFEDFLKEKCFEEYPMTLDDDQEDVYERWLCNLDIEEAIAFAEEALIEAHKNINKNVIPF